MRPRGCGCISFGPLVRSSVIALLVTAEIGCQHGSAKTLPPLPPTNSANAVFWTSISGVTAVRRVRTRGDIAYVAADPEPLRIDLTALTYRMLARPNDSTQQVQDIVTPIGGNRVVIAYASQSGARTIQVSNDDGTTWSDASGPPVPSSQPVAIPSDLVSFPDTGGSSGRTFMTYGGTTLDVSDDGGRSWFRSILGGPTPAEGFALDAAGTTLWCVAEAVIDRVEALWLDVTPNGDIPSAWNGQVLDGWDANGVYSAENDPFDPHGIYIGGEGRLGYLSPDGSGGVSAEVRWNSSADSSLASEPYTYVEAILPSTTVKDLVVFGGGEQGNGPASVFESASGGAAPAQIELQGSPVGTVQGIVRADARLLFFVDTGGTLDIYAVSR
jgi:hypothetical protein